ncbi:MAG: MBL fold metallo-hydrolase [Muribaculaceae bacterium]|nr:MBL fold metallo-hydrolase [Muribaculaceae bacterium]
MKVTCLGHSGFAIETDGATLVFDYYIDEHNVLPSILERASRLYVFVSHSHRDHLNHDIFGWQGRYRVERFVIANECRRKLGRSLNLDEYPFTFIHHDEDYVDDILKVHAFNSTDVGVCFIVDVGGYRIFHAGDYNCWHFEQEQGEQGKRKALGDFNVILRAIEKYVNGPSEVSESSEGLSGRTVDLVMFPVIPNIGGDFAMGARLFLQAIPTAHFIPMHTWGRDREATQFHLYQSPHATSYHYLKPGNNLEL